MASHDNSHSDFVHGNMDIADQKATYEGFITVSLWSSLLIGLLVIFLTLAFSVHLPWMPVLFGCAAIGVVAGILLKMPGSWYGTLIGTTVLGLIIGGIFSLVQALS